METEDGVTTTLVPAQSTAILSQEPQQIHITTSGEVHNGSDNLAVATAQIGSQQLQVQLFSAPANEEPGHHHHHLSDETQRQLQIPQGQGTLVELSAGDSNATIIDGTTGGVITGLGNVTWRTQGGQQSGQIPITTLYESQPLTSATNTMLEIHGEQVEGQTIIYSEPNYRYATG